MRRLRIFISSPGDVQKERQVARSIISRLAAEFAEVVALDPYFWEYEPMRVTADFQTQIEPPSEFDIVVCILWSRLGTPLRAPDGRHYQSGTEYEVNTAIAAYRQRGSPDVLVYHSQNPAQIKRSPREAREQAYRQIEALEAFLEKLALDPESGTVKGAIIRYANLAEFEERVEAHLRKLIVERVGEPPRADAAAPAWEGSPFRGLELFDFEHASIFFGRTKAIGEVVDMLRRQANRTDEQAALSRSGAGSAAPEPDGQERQAPAPRPAIFVLISAMSGAGKSSLVRAGVLPLLTRPGVVEGVGLWRRATMLPSTSSGDLFDSLALALIQPEALPELASGDKNPQQVAAMLRRSPASVDLLISQTLAHAAELLRFEEDRQLERMIEKFRSEGRTDDADRCADVRRQLKPRAARLALLVDQLEEIFTLPRFRDSPEAAGDFVAALAALARSGRVFVIATLRSDFFGRCAELPELMELKAGDGHYDLALPTSPEIGQIIRQPAIAAGLHYETIGDPGEGLALDERLRDDAIGHPEALPLLEYCLSGLYELRRGNLLTHEAYGRLGGVEAALAKRAEDVFQNLDSAAQDAFDPAMRRLTTASREKDGIAYARSWADYQQLCEINGAKAFVDAFVGPRARLFIAGQDEADRAVVTLTHEALLRAWPRLARWLTANSEMLQVKAAVAVAANHWVEAEKDAGYLLPRGLQLEKAKSAARDGYLEKAEAQFVQASIQAERKIIVRRRLAFAGLFGIVTAVAGAALQYGWQRYDQGRLSIESNQPTAKVRIDDVELGLPVTNFAVRSGAHVLRAFANGFIDRTETVEVKRGDPVPVQSYLWLEKGLDWTYSSPAIQSGLAVLPDAGGPPLIAHNEITQIIFLSAADGKVVRTIPTPTGNWRTFKTVDLGGDAGTVLVSGLDQEQSGPDLVAIRGTAPPQVSWTWKGPPTGYATPQSLAVEPLPRPGGSADLLVAGRDGHVYVLDGKTGKELQTITLSDQPLAASPMLFAWQDGHDTIVTAVIRPGDPNRYSTAPLDMVALSLRLQDGAVRWRRGLGTQWNPALLPLAIDGHPQVFLYSEKNWQMLDAATGATHGLFTLPAPLIGGPALADIAGTGKPHLVFEFADASQPMVAVDDTTGATVWRGPAGLNPSVQPRYGYNVLQTSSGALLVETADSLAAVDSHSGTIAWRMTGVPRGVLVGDRAGDGSKEILVTMSGVGLLCLDGSGNVLWTLRLDDDVEPWTLIAPHDGGPRDILIHRHAGLIGLVHGPSMLWERKANAAVQSTPLVAKDAQGHAAVIEFAPWGNDVALRAFDGAYGKILWSAKDNLSPNRAGTLADIDHSGQTDVVAVSLPTTGTTNQLIVYRPADGKVIRARRTTLNTWLSCAPAVADYRGIGKSDVAFSTWDDRSIVMLDGSSGAILWRFATGSPNMSGVASADLDGDGLPDVVAASPGGYVYGLRGKDGKLLWKTPIPGGAWSVPVSARLDANAPPYILVTSFAGGLYVLNSRTGAIVWSHLAGGAPTQGSVSMGDVKVGGHAVVVGDAGRTLILAPTGAGGVVAIDWQTRTESWRSPGGFPVINTPVAVELTGHRGLGAVVAAATGDVWTLALADGKPLWHRQFSAKTVEADPVVTDLDSDGAPDILLAGYDFDLRAINGRGAGIERPLADASSAGH